MRPNPVPPAPPISMLPSEILTLWPFDNLVLSPTCPEILTTLKLGAAGYQENVVIIILLDIKDINGTRRGCNFEPGRRQNQGKRPMQKVVEECTDEGATLNLGAGKIKASGRCKRL